MTYLTVNYARFVVIIVQPLHASLTFMFAKMACQDERMRAGGHGAGIWEKMGRRLSG